VIGAVRVGDAECEGDALEERVGVIGVAAHVEGELVVALRQLRPVEKVANSAVRIGLQVSQQLRAAVVGQAEQRDADALGGLAAGKVEDVGADGGARVRHGPSDVLGHDARCVRRAYAAPMADLAIRVGEQEFRARWEDGAPRTRQALLPWLPIRSRLIHCKWSGESTWIPFGDRRPDVGFENHTSHPAPGDLLIYTGEMSECEILFPYGACSFSSRVGQLAGNHFATLIPDEGWLDRLREVGRRVLWEGAQEIEIRDGGG
jgi:hypothetical protein